MSDVHTVPVDLAERSYDVLVGSGLLDDLASHMQRALDAPPARCFLAFDSGLPDDVVAKAEASLRTTGCALTTCRLRASERDKSLGIVAKLLNELAASRHERRDPVIALGGGIVGDVAGFAAATYRRGVPVIQCPTTLLSMVDASVGGKTGVNLLVRDEAGNERLAKNMAGAFWQPSLVIADVGVLRSLDDRTLRSGLAECLKHGMLAAGIPEPAHPIDPALFDWTVDHLDRLMSRDKSLLAELVRRNVAVKAAVVAGDERERNTGSGGRALLNLGHTFAHAIETLPDLSPTNDPADAPLMHGEAVLYGVVAASAAAASLDRIEQISADRVKRVVRDLGLAFPLAKLPANETLVARMRDDKKVAAGKLRLVVPTGEGVCEVIDDPPARAVQAGWDALRV